MDIPLSEIQALPSFRLLQEDAKRAARLWLLRFRTSGRELGVTEDPERYMELVAGAPEIALEASEIHVYEDRWGCWREAESHRRVGKLPF